MEAGSLRRLSDLQPTQHQPGNRGQRREADHQRAGEVRAGFPDVPGRAGGEGHRDAGESDQDDGAGRDGRPRLGETRAPIRFGLLHFAAQDQAGANAPDADQGRQREEQATPESAMPMPCAAVTKSQCAVGSNSK